MKYHEVDELDLLDSVLIDGRSIKIVKKVMQLLYNEQTLTGDQMRDAAQELRVAVEVAEKA